VVAVLTPRDLQRALTRYQLLLASDAVLPSVATLVAGEPVRGSWWAHPRSHAIFAAVRALEAHPDALAVPLVAGKVTFVHRALWPALLAVAGARERWQTSGLSAAARGLLKKLEQVNEIEASGDPVREIARRLLARTHEVHTERGSHATQLERWERWADRSGTSPLNDAVEAKRTLEEALAKIGGGRGKSRLPWP
jgi:hypothetical protein